MKEKSSVSEASSVSLLFASPLSYATRQPRKTVLVIPAKDDKGASIALTECVEDKMKDILQLDFHEQLLSTLIDKGIDPKTLNMIDVSKLGCDAGVEQLANHIISHVDDYVVKPKTEEK